MSKNMDGRPIECKKCGYKWLTKSELYYITCPRCRRNVKIREPETLKNQ